MPPNAVVKCNQSLFPIRNQRRPNARKVRKNKEYSQGPFHYAPDLTQP
jgi:hypothetical protein